MRGLATRVSDIVTARIASHAPLEGFGAFEAQRGVRRGLASLTLLVPKTKGIVRDKKSVFSA